MSTRAIVGYCTPDGAIIGGWQWNDGDDLNSLLRNNFKTLQDLKILIAQGSWSIYIGPRQKSERLWAEKVSIEHPDTYKLIKLSNQKGYVFKQAHQEAEFFVGDPGVKGLYDGAIVFNSIEDAIGQDVNYVYVFNPKTCKWTTFRCNVPNFRGKSPREQLRALN